MDYVDTQSVKEGNIFAFEPHPHQIHFDYVHLTSLSDLWFKASPPDVIYIGRSHFYHPSSLAYFQATPKFVFHGFKIEPGSGLGMRLLPNSNTN